jgi:hypothetical protein
MSDEPLEGYAEVSARIPLGDVTGGTPITKTELEEFNAECTLWKCAECGAITLTDAESGPLCPSCGDGVHVTFLVTDGRPTEHAAKLAKEMQEMEEMYETLDESVQRKHLTTDDPREVDGDD